MPNQEGEVEMVENKKIETRKFQMKAPEVFCKKGVLKNLAKFSGKRLSWSPFFNKVEACNFI